MATPTQTDNNRSNQPIQEINQKKNYRIFKRKLGQAFKNNDDTHLDTYYKRYKENNKSDPQTECMLISLSNDNLDIAKSVFHNAKVKNESLYTAIIKVLCANGDHDTAMRYFEELCSADKPHVRTFIPLFAYESEKQKMDAKRYNHLIGLIREYNIVPTLELFGNIVKCIVFNLESVDNKQKLDGVLKWMSEFYHQVPEDIAECVGSCYGSVSAGAGDVIVKQDGKCVACDEQLCVMDITEDQRMAMLDSLQFPGLSSVEKFVTDKHFDVVVDGANVAMFNNSPFNWKKVDKLLGQIDHKKQVLLVFHIGRKKQAAKIPKRKNVTVYFSKQKEDDDLTWMYVTLKLKCMCVTADKMGDHLYYKFSKKVNRNVFEKWVKSSVIRYDFSEQHKNWLKIIYPAKYSTRVQVSDNCVHIPVQNVNHTKSTRSPKNTKKETHKIDKPVDDDNDCVWYCIKKN